MAPPKMAPNITPEVIQPITLASSRSPQSFWRNGSAPVITPMS